MKTSGILLIVSLFLMGLKVVKPELTGIILLKENGEPKNSIVSFWMNAFDHKNTPDTLTVDFKHLKVEGGEKINLEILPEEGEASACFMFPESQTWRMAGDTLIIHAKNNLKGSYIKIYNDVKSLDVVGGTRLLINQMKQGSLQIEVRDRSKLILVSNVWTSGGPDPADMRRLENLRIKASGESLVELSNLVATSVSADIRNSMLKYWSNLVTDTVQVNLRGKSNVKAMDWTQKSAIGTLVVSGDKTCFKPEFVGEGVRLVVE